LAGGALTLRLGGSYHSGLFEDFGAISRGDAERIVRGLYSFYAIHDLVLVTAPTGQPKLAVFGRIGLSPQQDRSVVAAYADAGFNWFAPLLGRPDDIVGVGVSSLKYGHDFRVADRVAATETAVECTYKAQVTYWLALQVDGQFLFNPATGLASGRRETAVVLGLRTQVSF
jgi:carbohydrate-selective porin OprB